MKTETSGNRLIKEKSPYLLQHAYNPVDWYAWGPEAFEAAKQSVYWILDLPLVPRHGTRVF